MSTATTLARRPCCRIRLDLANDLSTAARLYSEAVVLLTSLAPQSSNLELMHEKALIAQQRAESAQVAFEAHVRNHSC